MNKAILGRQCLLSGGCLHVNACKFEALHRLLRPRIVTSCLLAACKLGHDAWKTRLQLLHVCQCSGDDRFGLTSLYQGRTLWHSITRAQQISKIYVGNTPANTQDCVYLDSILKQEISGHGASQSLEGCDRSYVSAVWRDETFGTAVDFLYIVCSA